MTSPKLKLRKGGFTLLELLVVITIIGILSAMATVGFQTIISKEKIRGETESVSSFLTRVAAETRNFNGNMSVQLSSKLLSAFKTDDCSGAPAFSTPLYDATITPHNPADLPSGNAAGVSITAWLVPGCMQFVPNKVLHPLVVNGWMEIRLDRNDEFRGIIFKRTTVNKVQSGYSMDGGDVWTLP